MRQHLVYISKIGKKGTLFIPKAIRELVGINERTLIIIEAEGDRIIIKPLRVLRVRASNIARSVIEKALSEEYEIERERERNLIER